MGQQGIGSAKETITGQLGHIRMRNQQSGYAFFELQTGNEKIVCKGVLIEETTGIQLQAQGGWEEDPKWGRQFLCGLVTKAPDNCSSVEAVIKRVPGISNRTAGQAAKAVLNSKSSSERIAALQEIRGLTPGKAREVNQCLVTWNTKYQVWEFLHQHDIHSLPVLRSIMEQWGGNAMYELLRDPYSVGTAAGISFHICETIAHSLQLPAAGKVRMRAIIQDCMSILSNNGHTCYPYPDFVETVRKRTSSRRKGPFTEPVSVPTIMLMLDSCTGSFLARDKNSVYLRDLRQAEISVANNTVRLLRGASKINIDIGKLCEHATRTSGLHFEGRQRDAFRLLQHGGLCILTGGPGTGKTTTLCGLLDAYEKLFPSNRVKLCAPTGRAAQRLREATGREASTIHRLLEMCMTDGVLHHRDRETPIDADLLIVDEASMLGIRTAALLFDAIPSGTQVILTGDTDQLPAVEPGNVLQDLLQCGRIPSVCLTQTLRQAEGSLIIENATRIRTGRSDLEEGPDFEIVRLGSEAAIAPALLKHYLELYDETNMFASQILTPVRNRIPGNTCNATVLNEMIQASVNPSGKALRRRDLVFRAGDKVMMMRNNYDAGYYNGDMGIVTQVYDQSMSVLVEGQELRIGQDLIDDVSLSFATTVHKSQGSEFDRVCIVLPPNPAHMLRYKILYTAVTRARKKATIFTVPGCIGKAVSSRSKIKRYSRLCERIQAA